MKYNDETKMCLNIYVNYKSMGREMITEDSIILDTIMRVYNNTEIGGEEVKWLWITYLESGNLCISEAIEMARERTAYEDMLDRKETKESLIAWLHQSL